MAQTLEYLSRQNNTLGSIRGIVHTMKTLSAINAAPYEQAARSIKKFMATADERMHNVISLNARR
mgnify:CR=1 FL=1